MRIKCLAQGYNTWCSQVQCIKHQTSGLPLSGLIQQTIFVDDIFVIIFFTKKTGFDISCNRKLDLTFHAMETICMKCQILFSRKNEKNISKCPLLKILPRVLSFKVCTIKSRMSLCMAKPTIKLVQRNRSVCTLWVCTSVVWSEPSLIVCTSYNLWV